jgi:glycerol-3-phosphate dehydrogenase
LDRDCPGRGIAGFVESRDASLVRLRAEPLDVLVIGGGINGAGIIRDLALRSKTLRLAVVDRAHFSSGTSGRNSQLIHGGLRYLKNLEFSLVSEALAERAILLRTAPHLVTPLPFLIPLRDLYSTVFYESGLFLYDTLAGRNRIERFRHLSGNQLHAAEPHMRTFVAGARFFDCQVHSARLVLLNLREAAANGAIALNYCSVEKLEKQMGLWRVDLLDRISGAAFSVQAKTVVDAAGPWSREKNLRLVRGSHLIFPRLSESGDAIAYFTRDGRVVFFIPWGSRKDLTLVGTTDVDHDGSVDSVRISEEEVRYLRGVIEEVFPGAGSREAISSYSSLRPLVRDDSSSATKTSREHRIWADERGMVHVSGGKYTTYRAMSEEAVDLLCSAHFPSIANKHVTADTPILGNSREAVQSLLVVAYRAATVRSGPDHALPASSDMSPQTVHDYGVETPALLSLLPQNEPAGISRLEAAQIAFAAQNEWVEHLPDLLFVSTYWGYEKKWTPELLLPYARALGAQLNWDEARVEQEIMSVPAP